MNFTKKNIWLHPNQICIIRGNAVALNLMFENKKDHKIFLKMWDKYLGGMTEVLNYHLSPTEWTILFKTKSSKEIIHTYRQQRKKSRKAKHEFTLQAPKKMLSEHIRIFLSQYVRNSNYRHGRKGTRVMERFHKYIIRCHAEYEKIFRYITNQERFPAQSNQRYRADESRYDINNEIVQNGFLCVGNAFYRKMKGNIKYGNRILVCMRIINPKKFRTT